jgi:hypothetical protein
MVPLLTFSQGQGDWSPSYTGNWSDDLMWYQYNEGEWVDAYAYPTSPISDNILLGELQEQVTITMDLPMTLSSGFNIIVYSTVHLILNEDLTIENGATLAINYNGRLTIGAGVTLTIKGQFNVEGSINNNGNLVIESSATESGSMVYNASISGTYKQTITNGVWHLIGVPMTGVELGAFDPAGGDGYMRPYVTATPGWGDYMYDESTVLNVGQGYEYWTTVNNTVSVSGTFYNGNKSLTLSTAGNKYNLIANPYPCALDWETVADNANVTSGSVYYYNATGGTNGYAVYSAASNTGTFGATQFIPPFQGFFVEQTGGDASMDFTNENKAHPDHEFYKNSKSEGISDRVRIQISQDEFWSETVVVGVEGATSGYDRNIDTRMPTITDPVAPEIYSKGGDEKIMINGIGDYPAVVPLELDVLIAGIIKLQVTEMSDMLPYTLVELEDRQTGTFYTLTPTFMGLNINVEQGILRDRFFVHYSSTVGIDEQDVNKPEIYSARNIVYIKNNNQVEYDYQIINMLGQVIAEGQNNGSQIFSVQLDQPAAYYLVKVTTNDLTTTEKLYISK